jgi:hypothetical protein
MNTKRKLGLHAKKIGTYNLNPSSWQCYFLCWRIRHELKSSEEGEGGEGKGKATA